MFIKINKAVWKKTKKLHKEAKYIVVDEEGTKYFEKELVINNIYGTAATLTDKHTKVRWMILKRYDGFWGGNGDEGYLLVKKTIIGKFVK